jgi:hypothetical protein
MNLDAVKKRLNKLQNSNSQSAKIELWKPAVGNHQVRLVPYKFNKEYPFVELYFHYNISKRTYVSPISFGNPDPIVEFAERLKRMGDREDWKSARKMEPKLRIFVPVLVRGEEHLGVRFWSFGKSVYQDILKYMADPDYGDITNPVDGRDIVVEVQSPEESGTSYTQTTIRVKPKETPLADTDEKINSYLDNQASIDQLYQEPTYDELKIVLKDWLNPDDLTGVSSTNSSVSQDVLSAKNTSNSTTSNHTPPQSVDSQPATSVQKTDSKKIDDVASAFDDLFNSGDELPF